MCQVLGTLLAEEVGLATMKTRAVHLNKALFRLCHAGTVKRSVMYSNCVNSLLEFTYANWDDESAIPPSLDIKDGRTRGRPEDQAPGGASGGDGESPVRDPKKRKVEERSGRCGAAERNNGGPSSASSTAEVQEQTAAADDHPTQPKFYNYADMSSLFVYR